MKRITYKLFSILLVLILGFGISCNKDGDLEKESQSDEPIEYFTYFNGGITGLTQEGQLQRILTVPTEINGKKITYIGSNAFEDCSALQEITLLEGVTRIEENAFSGCTALSKITLPSTIELINDNAFYLCVSLKEIALPKSLALIDQDAFYGCNALEKIVYDGSFNDWQEIDIHQDWSLNANSIILDCNGAIYQYGFEDWEKVEQPQQ